jgi:hypothetical protein
VMGVGDKQKTNIKGVKKLEEKIRRKKMQKSRQIVK